MARLATLALVLLSSSVSAQIVTTPTATEQQSELAGGAPFPASAPLPLVTPEIQDATSGTPRIDLVRGGQVITSFASFVSQPGCVLKGDGSDSSDAGVAAAAATGCGPFNRVQAFTLLKANDVLMVYPAVYSGQYQQPYIGFTYDTGADFPNNPRVTTDVSVLGVVINQVRPVINCDGGASNNTLNQSLFYIGDTIRVTVSNINIAGGPGCSVGKSGLYVDNAADLTTSYMHIHDMVGSNGVFSTSGPTGTWTMIGLELDHNGGPNGPAHNAYIGASVTDPNFKVVFRCSWTHDAYYGHLFKIRAQNWLIDGDYFQGGVPTGGNSQAEAYLIDESDGGNGTVRNSVLFKTASGPDSNGIGIAYDFEGSGPVAGDAPRLSTVSYEHNLFLAGALTYDGSHVLFPLGFYYPLAAPDTTAFPPDVPVSTLGNVFAGFEPLSGAPAYRGSSGVIASTAEVGADGRTTGDAHVLSGPVGKGRTYQHPAMCGPMRMTAMAGAYD